jgi:hypothetical protein
MFAFFIVIIPKLTMGGTKLRYMFYNFFKFFHNTNILKNPAFNNARFLK